MKKRIIATAISLLLCLGLFGCGTGTDPVTRYEPNGLDGIDYNYTKQSEETLYFGGDDGMSAFLNDYYQRHVRNGDKAIHYAPLGTGSMFMKEWEAMGLMFADSTSAALSYNGYSNIAYWLNNIPIDKFGYVWQDMGSWGQGWEFPTYADSNNNSVGWQFGLDDDNKVPSVPDSGEWTDNAGGTMVAGLYQINVSETDPVGADGVTMTSPVFDPVTRRHGPFMTFDFKIYDKSAVSEKSSISDIVVYYRVEGDAENEWKSEQSVSLLEDATIGLEYIPASFSQLVYFPMYLYDNWDDVIQLKVEFVPKVGKKINSNINVNSAALNYDTRHSNNIEEFLTALKLYVQYTGDAEMLSKNLNRARQAILFMTKTLGGEENNLIDQGYMMGHDGVGGEFGYGVGNGYWDILSLPAVSFYANVYYVRALDAMIYLEQAAEALGVDTGDCFVYDGRPETLGQTIAYDYTAENLQTLREAAAEQMNKPLLPAIEEEDGTCSFDYAGGFWNENTGRFAEGYDLYGNMLDYGFLAFNLEAICSDIPTAEHALSIMDWVTGERIVAGDDAVGKYGTFAEEFCGKKATVDSEFGIYDLEFAPRSTTKHNDTHYYWGWTAKGFGEQVQDGGALMYVSYHDIMARLKVYGADSAMSRLREIRDWYQKVEESNTEGSDPTDFYRNYYTEIGVTMQGGGTDGGIGLDVEFFEACILYTSVPDGLFGISPEPGTQLAVSPLIAADAGVMKLENLMYHNVKYDVSAAHNFVQIDSVRGDTRGLTVKVTLKKPESGDFKVYVSGKRLSPGSYTEDEDTVTVTLPFAACRVAVVAAA